jgi:hypothetical protein
MIGIKDINTDIRGHSELIKSFIETHSLPANFLYYLLVYSFSGFSLDIERLYFVSLLLLTLAVVFKYYFSYRLATVAVFNDFHSLDNSKYIIVFLVLTLLLIIHPIITPLDTKNGMFYLGKASINIWHNSTTILVMPFILLMFFFSYQFLINPHIKNLILLLLFGILTAIVKPSFIFCFLIVFPFFLLFKYKLSGSFFLALLFLFILMIIIGLEYYSIFRLNSYGEVFYNSTSDGIRIAPFQAWAHYSENIPIDLLSSIAFPLFFSVIYFKNLKNILLLQYTWSLFIVALVIGILFIEDGPRMWHLNFFWQVPMTNYLLFLFTSITYLKILFQKSFLNIVDYVLIIIWISHVISGLIYLRKFLFLLDYH